MIVHQEWVTQTIQDLLLEFMEQEVGPLKSKTFGDYDFGDGVARPDVEMIALEPRMMPWIVYKSHGSGIYDKFVDHRFPETMANLPFKTVWRGLQNPGGASIDSLLSAFRCLSKIETIPATADAFALSNQCHISHNMGQSLAYIGSHESMEVISKAIRSLDTMVNLLVCIPPLLQW